MADDSKDFLLRIIIQTLNKAKGGLDEVAKTQDKFRKDQERAEAEHQKKMSVAEKKRFDETSRRTSKRLADEVAQSKRRLDLEKKLNDDLVKEAVRLETARHAHQQQRAAEEKRTLDQSIREEERATAKRKGFVLDLLDAVRQRDTEVLKSDRKLVEEELKDIDRRARSWADYKESRRAADAISADNEIKESRRVEKEIQGSIKRRESLERQAARSAVSRAKQINRRVEDALKQDVGGGGIKSKFQDLFEGNADSVAKLDNQLRGFATLGLIGFAQQFITILTSLAGAFIAVASSAAVAGTAIAAAMTSAAAQAIPAIGLIVAAFGRVGAVFKAVQQSNKAGVSASTDAAAAMEQQRNAANRVREAHEGVIDADRRMKDSRRAVTAAVREARRELEDLADAERSAQQAAEGALLTLDESRRALRRSIASGDVEGTSRAQLGVDEAKTGLSQAVRDRDRTSADATRTRQGEGGAQQGLKDARRNLEESARSAAKARRQLKEAAHDAETAGKKTSAAATGLNNLLAGLSKAERKLFDSVILLQKRYREAFGPITDILIRSFTRGVDSVSKLITDPRITKPFTTLANSMAGAFDRIREAMTSSESVRFFGVMTREAAKSQKPISEIVVSLFKLFRNIAEAGIPAFRLLVGWLEQITKGWADGTKNTDKLSKFFLMGARWAIDWFNLAGAVIQLFAALAGAGGGETGTNIIKDFTKAVRDATKWVNANREQVAQFFRDSSEVLHQVGRVLVAIGAGMMMAFDPESVETLANLLVEILIPALVSVILFIGTFTQGLEKILTLPGMKQLTQLFLAFGIGSIILKRLIGVVGLFTESIKSLLRPLRILIFELTAIDIASAPFLALAAAIAATIVVTALMVKNFGWLKTAIVFVFGGPFKYAISIVLLLLKHFGVLDDVVRAVGNVFRTVTSPIRGFIGWLKKIPAIDSIFKGIGSILKDVGGFFSSAANKVKGFVSSIGRLIGTQDKSKNIQDRLSKATDGYRDAVDKTRNAINRLRTAEDRLANKRLDARQAAIDVRAAERDLRDARARARRGEADPDEVAQAEISLERARLNQKSTTGELRTEESNTRKERERSAKAIKSETKAFKDQISATIAAIEAGVLKFPKFLSISQLKRKFDSKATGGWTGADVMLSPGEVAVEPSGRTWTVPGRPTAADSVMANVPPGTGILTWSGQMMRSMGASLHEAIANQLPHFKDGGFTGPDGSGAGFGPLAAFMLKKWGIHAGTGRLGHSPTTLVGSRSDHSWGGAVDFPTGSPHETRASVAAARWLSRRLGHLNYHRGYNGPGAPALKQLIHQVRDKYGDHFNHIHIALQRAYAFSAAKMSKLLGGSKPVDSSSRSSTPATRTRRVPITAPLFRSVAASTRGKISALSRANTTTRGGPLGTFAQGVFKDVRNLGGALKEDLATRIRVGTRTITTRRGVPEAGGGSSRVQGSRRRLPADLQKYNKRYKAHWSPDFSGPTMPRNAIAKLAEWAGMPGVTMTQIAHGESGYRPGAAAVDPGGRTKGYGLWQITSPYHNDKVGPFGGYPGMWNPISSAIVAAKAYKARGLAPWKATKYLTDRNAHWRGRLRNGGFVGPQRFQNGGVAQASRATANPISEVLRAFGMIGRTTTNFVSRTLSRSRNLARSISLFFADMVGEGGFFDDFTARMEALRTDVTTHVQRSTFKISKVGKLIKRTLSPEAIAGKELDQLQAEYRLLMGERGALSTQLKAARLSLRKAGKDTKAKKLAQAAIDNILERIRNLNTTIGETVISIGEATEAALSATVDKINDAAARSLASLDLRGRRLDIQGRVADLRESVGDLAGAFGMRGSILGERGRILQAQRPTLLNQQKQLTGALVTALGQGNQTLAQGIRDQLTEVSVALDENAVATEENKFAIKANTSAFRAARIDEIGRKSTFLTGTFGGLGGLLEAFASASGGTVDLGRQKGLIEQTITALTSAGASYRNELFKWLGIDTRGLDPVRLADMLRALDFDKAEVGLTTEDRGRFESLIGSIIDNATSVQQNTDQLKQLNSPNSQSFTSTAWQWFRNAIFDGAGGLLPQYRVPSAASGAMITQGGLLMVHDGEAVVPAQVTSSQGAGNVEANVYVTEQVESADADVIALRLGHRLKYGSS